MKHYKQLLEQLKNKTTVGNRVSYTPKGRKYSKFMGVVIDEVNGVDEYCEYKHFVQKIKRKKNDIQYRICYYTIDHNKNKIMFVRAPSIISPKCFKKLIQEAVKKKGFL